MKGLEELERLARQYKVQPYAQDAFVLAASPDFVLSLIRELKITRYALATGAASFVLSNCNAKNNEIARINVIELWKKNAERELYPETEQP